MIDYPHQEEAFLLRIYKAVHEFSFRIGKHPEAILVGGEAYHILLADHRNVITTPYDARWRGIPLLRMDLGSKAVYLISDVMAVPAQPELQVVE